MIENKIDKAMKPIPVPYEEFESFSMHVEEFFDLIARRAHIYRTVKFPLEIKPEGVKAILKNGLLENQPAEGGIREEGEDRGQATLAQPHQPNGDRGLLCTRGGVPR